MDTNGYQAIIDAARMSVSVQSVNRGNLIAINAPADSTTEIKDLESFSPQPARKRGTFDVFTAQSFVDYLKDHATPATRIFADANPSAPEIVGVFNAHGKSEAGWHDHRVKLVFRETPEWQRWKAANNKKMSQLEFAEFIEDNLKDVAEPDGADMIEIAQTLDATRNVSFKQGTRLDNGAVNLHFNETIEGRAGATASLQIPKEIVLGLRPYEGSDAFKIRARFRWRIDNDSRRLVLWYTLERLPDVVSAVVKDAVEVIRAAGIPLLYGKHPAL